MTASATPRPAGPGPGPARFMGLDLAVLPGTFSPREETELLARVALDLLAEMGAEPVAVDMCCGSGNLGCALAARLPGLRVHAADILESSAETARANAAALGLSGRLTARSGDLFAAVDPALRGRVDLVVCNPPYISTARLAGDRAHLVEREPREAFDGGPYGISILQRLVAEAPDFLRPGGALAFEFGEGQDRQIPLLFRRSRRYAAHGFVDDAAGVPRVAVARTRP